MKTKYLLGLLLASSFSFAAGESVDYTCMGTIVLPGGETPSTDLLRISLPLTPVAEKVVYLEETYRSKNAEALFKIESEDSNTSMWVFLRSPRGSAVAQTSVEEGAKHLSLTVTPANAKGPIPMLGATLQCDRVGE